MNKFIKLIVIIIILIFNSNLAYAYLDPGTGSIILQAVIAFIALIGSYIGFYWKKVKNFFKNFFKKKMNKN